MADVLGVNRQDATGAIRALLAEPRVPGAPARVWRDWAVVAAVVVGSSIEAIARDDVPWPIPTLVVSLVVAACVPVRRTHPLVTTLLAFGAIDALSIAAWAAGRAPAGFFSMAVVLVIPYALFRWGSGREVAIGVPVMLVVWAIGVTTDPGTVGEAIGGFAVVFLTAALGAMMRYRGTVRSRELEEVKLREREQLARELHDTVAHHVSAIAVQAQAARAVAATRPDVALDILAVIEDAASRTLDEMRAMVGALRRDDEPDLAPLPGLRDIERLVDGPAGAPPVRLELTGDLDDLRPSLGTALYRLAQESITNARRHARQATHVDVRVVGSGDAVRLTVTDDGLADAPDRLPATGYGLRGMAERAELLGGTLHAGPNPERGWTVTAVLPRDGAPA